MIEPAVLALAEAMHDHDEACNSNYYVAFAECGWQAFDIGQAEQVLLTLRKLGWRLAQEPAGTVPLWESVSA